MPSAARLRERDSPVYEEDVEELVNRLQQASSARHVVSKDDIAAAVSGISQHASVRGLSKEALDSLIDILTSAPCRLDQSTQINIIKSLLPRYKVAEEIAVKVVGCFGQGGSKPPLTVQASLLRWLVMVYNILENYSQLSQLYGVLFSFLDMISLRGNLCHLLSLLTRRKHIKPFRIQALLELRRTVGNEQPLSGLLQTYKNYYPDVIVGDIGPCRAGVFSHPNPEWIQRVIAIQEANAVHNTDRDEKAAFKVARRAEGQITKRRKTEEVQVPEVHTFRAVESSVTLEEVDNVDDFIDKLDKLELPNQLVAVLGDPLLQKLLLLKPSGSADIRINNWLALSLSDELRLSGNVLHGVPSRHSEMLSMVCRFTRSTGQLLLAVEDFVHKYLQTREGLFREDSIFGLIQFLPLREFEDMYTTVFKHLEKVAKSGSEMSRVKLLELYSELLRHWTVLYDGAGEERWDDKGKSLQRFIHYVGELCLLLLQGCGRTSLVADAVLSFYECASSLPWNDGLFRIVLPPDSLVYHFVFVGDSMMLSRLCGILSRYKQAFELSLKQAQPAGNSGDAGDYPRLFVDHFNGFLMDICNCLWRNRAFAAGGPDSKQDQNALGCTLPLTVVTALKRAAEDREESLQSLFSLSHSAVLARLSTSCFRAMEDDATPDIKMRHSGPVTQRSLSLLFNNGGLKMSYSDFRVAVLNDLNRKGLVGIYNFMHSTMISLIQSASTTSRFSSRAPTKS